MGETEEGLLTSLDRLDSRVKRIAIVEDNPDARRLLRRVLQARGEYQIFEAAGGQEGIDLVRRERPDLVLLDLMMPGKDGYQVLREKEADEAIRAIPVVVVSARDPLGDEIATDALLVSRQGGLPARQVLELVQGISALLAPEGLAPMQEGPAGPGQPETVPG
jgi:CheY-like chemotaxis protein